MSRLANSVRVVALEEPEEGAEVDTSVVKKTPGKGYCVKSEKKDSDWSGGCFPSKGEAEKRLHQVEYFKHKGSAGLSKGELGFVASYCGMILAAEQPTEFQLEILHDLLASYNSE